MAEKNQRVKQTWLAVANAPEPAMRQTYKPFVPGPNPELPGFIKLHSTQYDPKTDKYDVKAFDRDIVVDKAAQPKAIYDMHTYWSKKHWAAIREYIRHYLPTKYYPEGTGLVLDCFSGSGMTGVAAMMENRPCVLIDASPAAAFISHCYTHPVDPDELQAAYDRMMTEEYQPDLKKKLKSITGEDIRNLQQELDWLYATKCDRCGGSATTAYVVYSESFQCPRCGEVVALFDCPEAKVPYLVGTKGKQRTELKKRRICPYCAKKYRDPHQDYVISVRTKRFGSAPVLVCYECQNGCRPSRSERLHTEPQNTRKAKYFEGFDIARLKTIDSAQLPHDYPQRPFLRGVRYHRDAVWNRGVENVCDIYTKRNLWALSAIKASIRRLSASFAFAEAWNIGFTGVSMNASKMYRYRPSLKGGLTMGTYYLPQEAQIMRVSSQFQDKKRDVLGSEAALMEKLRSPGIVTNVSATRMPVPNGSLDYIFCDPPYLNIQAQYGELNHIWESWLGFKEDWLADEIIVNPFRRKSVENWDQDMRLAFGHCFRALKPGRWISVCYHEVSPEAWTRLQNIILDSGFEIHTVTVLDPKQKTAKMLTMEKIVKGDLVLNCHKPWAGQKRAEGDDGEVGQVSRRVRAILIETLSMQGGQTRDKLWDIVLKRLLTRGQMAEHRFDDLLGEVATRSETGRWFLKEEFENLSESDLRNEEEAGAALERFGRLRCFGVPVTLAAGLALSGSVTDEMGEDQVEMHIKREVLAGAEGRVFKLSGRMKGCEFYDCLFFYLTRYLKGRAAGRTPRRNLAEFLEEYLVRFRDGDKWLYRPPTGSESATLKKSRLSGLGRRLRQFVAYLNGEGDFPTERIPDAKTLVAWLKHCANFGLAEAGVALFEKGGLMGELSQLAEEERYDAEDYYAQCRRNSGRKPEEEDEEGEQETGEE